MARKKKQPEHVNHERWLVSYADFITLLFATFTALFAMSNADLKKMAAASVSIKKAFRGGGGSGTSSSPIVFSEGGQSLDSTLIVNIAPPLSEMAQPSPSERSVNILKEELDDDNLFPGMSAEKTNEDDEGGGGGEEYAPPATPTPSATPDAQTPGKGSGEGEVNEALAVQIKDLLNSAGLKDAVEVRQEARGTVISLGEAAFFAPGSIEVLPQCVFQLDKIVNILRGKQSEIRIEGHTDNTPVTSGRYRNNWELSTLRATRIVDFMAREYHFSPALLSSAGYGEFRPIAENATAAGRQKNRRVDIVILNQHTSTQEPHLSPQTDK